MKRQAGWIAAETAVGMLGTVLTTFLVSRIVGPSEVGRAALAGAVVMLAQPFVGYCFTNAMVQRASLSDADVASVLWTSLAFALALAAPLAAVGLLLPDWLGPGVGPVLAALSLMLPFNAVEGTANGVLLRGYTFRVLALRGIGAHLAGFVAGLSLALAGWGAWALVGQQLACFGTAAVLAAAFARLAPLPVLRRDAIREMSPIAATAAATGLAGRVGFRLFLLVVAGGSPGLAGILQIAFRIVEVARELPTPFVHRYGLPALSRLRADRPAFLRRLEAVCRLSGLVFAPVFAGLALCAPEVQAALLGPAWAGIVAPVRVLSATLAFAAFGLPLGLAFVAAGMPIEAVPGTESIAIPETLVNGKRDTYVLRVRGDSMIDEQIRDGDWVVVEDRKSADNGEMVIALVSGQDATLKKFYKETGRVRLQPANPTMQPIFVDPDAVQIQGVVVGVMRKY